ncbi:hypothetical protein [Lentzea albida]|uniref:Uncharacterized protein n=1 Tax=Lentzea albida TaxID=65499 RepID=A0A1H9VIZ9_9PSEU|nr:hypothetical protein [Lentzea albida]SES21267.1 hypothetical protein SAMN04488000_118137 [Lentzea albida]
MADIKVRVAEVAPEDPRYAAVLDEFAAVFGMRAEEVFPSSWWGVSELDGEVFLSVGEVALMGLAQLSENPDAVKLIDEVIEDGPRPLRPLLYRTLLTGGA